MQIYSNQKWRLVNRRCIIGMDEKCAFRDTTYRDR